MMTKIKSECNAPFSTFGALNYFIGKKFTSLSKMSFKLYVGLPQVPVDNHCYPYI